MPEELSGGGRRMIIVEELIEKLKKFPKKAMVLGSNWDKWNKKRLHHIEEPWLSKNKSEVIIDVDELSEYDEEELSDPECSKNWKYVSSWRRDEKKELSDPECSKNWKYVSS
jgi:hypothetical protein